MRRCFWFEVYRHRDPPFPRPPEDGESAQTEPAELEETSDWRETQMAHLAASISGLLAGVRRGGRPRRAVPLWPGVEPSAVTLRLSCIRCILLSCLPARLPACIHRTNGREEAEGRGQPDWRIYSTYTTPPFDFSAVGVVDFHSMKRLARTPTLYTYTFIQDILTYSEVGEGKKKGK